MNSTDKEANLYFFDTEILQPAIAALRRSRENKPHLGPSVAALIGVIEIVHWARLGIQIGYLNTNEAFQLIQASGQDIFDAWYMLKTRNLIPGDHDWTRIFERQEDEKFIFNRKWFATLENTDAQSDLLQAMYQTLLLLLGENILDDASYYFLDSVSYAGELEWRSRFLGTSGAYEGGSAQALGLGFANVLNYWAEVYSLLAFEPNSTSIDGSVRIVGWEREEVAPIASQVLLFIQEVQAIFKARFNLDKIEILVRYFALAGEFANHARDNTPLWLDARLNTFETLASYASNFGGAQHVQENREQLWVTFTKGIDDSPLRIRDLPERVLIERFSNKTL
jgi:hypothetical protein